MEDAHCVVDKLPVATGAFANASFFYAAVFDGHSGKTAAEYSAANFHLLLTKRLEELPAGGSIVEMLKKCYTDFDTQMKEVGQIVYPGCTAVTSLIMTKDNKRTLFVANVGDAHAVLCRAGNKGERLTEVHRASNEEETNRIKSLGGFISGGRVNAMIEVTRSLGDHHMKNVLSAVPAVKELQLEPTDTHLLLGCDGIWDYVTEQDACYLVAANPALDAQALSKLFAGEAVIRGSDDNLTSLVIILK
eukprot:TRINITY_DN5607_c0_g1_i2.p1 TRINITY_DN5607_c0_g1~~TRINITY_DN5607_c0_g1_i2.p1  ORF type:complete len:277 (-),score=85.88 TRINITY_DN5607_c0_g1_i2:54-794(-)